ncbi:MAG: bestrophin family ion channel, partial [Myxococcota bacterium]
MHTGRRYQLKQTLLWSRKNIILPFLWATAVTAVYDFGGLHISIPVLPLTLVGTAVAFSLGFKNSSSYDRLWEARKIWGAIVNASRSWAYGARDM